MKEFQERHIFSYALSISRINCGVVETISAQSIKRFAQPGQKELSDQQASTPHVRGAGSSIEIRWTGGDRGHAVSSLAEWESLSEERQEPGWMDVWKIIHTKDRRTDKEEIWLLPQWYQPVKQGSNVVCSITKTPLCKRIEVRDVRMEFAAVSPNAYACPILPVHACNNRSQYPKVKERKVVYSVHCKEAHTVHKYLGGDVCEGDLVCTAHGLAKCGTCTSTHQPITFRIRHARHKLFLILRHNQGYWPAKKHRLQ